MMYPNRPVWPTLFAIGAVALAAVFFLGRCSS